ncbi:MAG: hypothetical protein BLM47_07180 [Candidatus Reconcilbacillus cellulovorans]|uniref:Uncharacterized protein n=1 Tax=Candidatus Reconcilbacillus cellulovorans TaxID=1906605 RepID=A0A2A6E116_9BACL|nr:MAG: hypothetical protein BLM47_07180 [Candidatus Reconcilbacillus cellulovorans]
MNENTVFHFRQVDDVVHADYSGGKVKMGKLIGLLRGRPALLPLHSDQRKRRISRRTQRGLDRDNRRRQNSVA